MFAVWETITILVFDRVYRGWSVLGPAFFKYYRLQEVLGFHERYFHRLTTWPVNLLRMFHSL